MKAVEGVPTDVPKGCCRCGEVQPGLFEGIRGRGGHTNLRVLILIDSTVEFHYTVTGAHLSPVELQ